MDWLIIRFVGLEKEDIRLGYETSNGTVIRFGQSDDLEWQRYDIQFETKTGISFMPIRIPQSFVRLLQQTLTEQDNSKVRGGSFPIYFDVKDGLPQVSSALDTYSVCQAIIQKFIPIDKVVILFLGEDAPRPPFRLPLRLSAFGRWASSAAELLKIQSWNQTDGILFNDCESVEVLLSESVDVVFIDESGLRPYLQGLERIDVQSPTYPRLIVGLYFPYAIPPIQPLPAGVAFLTIPRFPGDYAYLRRFILEITHDQPLHRAFGLMQFNYSIRSEIFLTATPITSNALRLSDAHEELRKELERLDYLAQWGKEQVSSNLLPRLIERLRSPLNAFAKLSDEFRTFTPDYLRESGAFGPISGIELRIESLRPELKMAQQQMLDWAARPEIRAQLYQSQVRVAHITLAEKKELSFELIDPNQPLLGRLTYRLRFRIGKNTLENLVTNPIPIDPLLPAAQGGYTLDVAVFAKDFTLRSSSFQSIYLPDLGESETADFLIEAPPEEGLAELRVAVYFKNNLLQSFLLTATIEQQRDYKYANAGLKDDMLGDGLIEYGYNNPDSREVTIVLELSQTENFSNLDALKERILHVGINRNVQNPSHTLMIKTNRVADDFHLSETTMKEFADDFRKTFADFSKFAAWDSNQYTIAYQDAFKRLADFGIHAHNLLFNRIDQEDNQDGVDDLMTVKTTKDQTIQIARFDEDFAFPWAICYDYNRPKNPLTADVCKGCPDGGCRHEQGEDIYCPFGFWGVKHRIEQLLSPPKQNLPASDRPERIAIESNPSLFLSFGIDTADTQRLRQELHKRFINQYVDWPVQDAKLLERLWDSTQRPYLLLFLSHYQKWNNEFGIFTDTQQSTPNWLNYRLIKEHRMRPDRPDNRRWKDPKAVVFLLTCDSAPTLNANVSLVSAFRMAGAAAIIGTECQILPNLAARFAQEMTTMLLVDKKPLGVAIQLFNKMLISEYNLNILAFSCFGSADLHFYQ